jgi:hypothetical protein
MIRTHNFLFYGLLATLGLIPASSKAVTPCEAVPGVWSFFALEVNPQRDADAGTAITCTLTVAINGDVTGTCKGWGQNGVESASASGNLTATNCVLKGTLNTLAIRGGYLSGKIGMGVATQSSTFGLDVMHFTLAKKN